MRTHSPRPSNPASLRTSDLPPSPITTPSESSISTSSSSTPLSPHFAPIRINTSPTSPSIFPRPPLLRSTSSPTTNTNNSRPTSSHISTTDNDSIWSASLSRYSFCSSNSQKSISQASSRSTSRTRTKKEKEKGKGKAKKRQSGTVTRCGRHGDEWLFGGWTDMIKALWK